MQMSKKEIRHATQYPTKPEPRNATPQDLYKGYGGSSNVLDYRQHRSPAQVRHTIGKLKAEQYANRTESHLCRELGAAITLLEGYLRLLEAMYLDSLHRHGLDLDIRGTD